MEVKITLVQDGSFLPTLEEVEVSTIRQALRVCSNMTEVAARLGVGRSTLYRKLEDYEKDHGLLTYVHELKLYRELAKESEYIRIWKAFRKTAHVDDAAEELGIDRDTLLRLMRLHGISAKEVRRSYLLSLAEEHRRRVSNGTLYLRAA